MILSFHPIIEAHHNILCAGREPGDGDLAAIRQAAAVILPQGCSEALYRMARHNCPHVFPNLDVRFDFPGKRGQIQLFDHLRMDYPVTESYGSVAGYHQGKSTISFPAVVKFDWGGQGETVFKVSNAAEMDGVLQRAGEFEATGQYGFIIQTFIPGRGRSLRVAAVGSRFISYWRLQPEDMEFGTSVSHGAAIDHSSDLHLQEVARAAAQCFCHQTGLQLAGFDFIFNETASDQEIIQPLLLEINYFFGRSGLGGSERYYDLVTEEVDKWLAGLSLYR